MTCHEALSSWGISVDHFTRAPNRYYFLTHAHRDHTKGLGARWCAGPLFVTPESAELLRHRFGPQSALASCLVTLPYRTWLDVGPWSVACTEANHSCGSAVWAFRRHDGVTAVHTGDYRWSAALATFLRPLRPVQEVFFDSTHHEPHIVLPTLTDGVAALEYLWHKLVPGQRLMFICHTTGTEALLKTFCQRHRVAWHLDDASLKTKAFELRLGLKGTQESPKARLWLIGESFRRTLPSSSDLFVRASSTWFVCQKLHRATFFRQPVPDRSKTFRLYFSTHASYAENQKLFQLLQPQRVLACAPSAVPEPCRFSLGPDLAYHARVAQGGALERFTSQLSQNTA